MNINSGTSKRIKVNNNKNPDSLKFDFPLIGLLITILFILYIRLRLLSFPLERDEGEFAYMAQLILKGYPPYSVAFNFKFPGAYYMYAFFISVFGQTVSAIHFGLMLINIITTIFIYLITKRLISGFAAFIASATFAILSLSNSFLGQAAHVTHFVAFFGIIGIYLLIRNIKSEKWYMFFFAGILMSFSILMKQSISFTLVALVIIIFNHLEGKMLKTAITNILIFFSGFIIPLAFIASLFLYYGNFNKFWFWTIIYVKEYGSLEPFSDLYVNLKEVFPVITKNTQFFWILFFAGIPFIFIFKKIKEIKWIIFFFTALSILSVFPGFYFRPHYFITLLPAFSIIIAILFDYLSTELFPEFKQAKYFGLLFFLLLILTFLQNTRDYLFLKSPDELSKLTYYGCPFVESVKLSEFIKSKTGNDDKILVLGSEPQIYFYSGRVSATPYIYMYDLMYDNNFALSMQKDLIRDMEKWKPKIMVYINIHWSWLSDSKSNHYIFTRFFDYVKKENYKLSGIIDNAGLMNSIYIWNEEVPLYPLPDPAKNFIFVYEKI